MPVGMAAEHELIDVVLTERWPLWRLRGAIASRIHGHVAQLAAATQVATKSFVAIGNAWG